MILEINKVSKRRSNTNVLKTITFTIKKGESVGLIGLNGAGKTTLIRCITTFINPSEGEIIYKGKSVFKNKNAFLERVGYLPENNPLYGNMYVAEYLEFMMKLHKVKIETATEIISQLDLTSKMSVKIQKLSKGYKQRVGIATSLLHNPEVLILDEPINGLDFKQQQQTYELIDANKRERITLISSHQASDIKKLCNRIIYLKSGEIEADEYIEKIKKKSVLYSFLN